MILCRVCNKKLNIVTNTHVATHDLSLAQYIARFGNLGVGFKINAVKLSKKDPRYIKWRKSLLIRPAPWNKGQTKEANSSVAKMAESLKRRSIDNFARWRELAKKKGIIPAGYPKLPQTHEVAFLIGLILGDGHIRATPRTESLRITLGTDKPLLWQHAGRVVRRIFKKKPNVRKRLDSNCVDITIYQKKLSKRLSVPMNARGKLAIKLPSWIWQNKKLLVSCLKGLFEAEGSFSIHPPTCTYNLQFSNKNVSLLDEVQNALIKLGFHPERRANGVRLRKRAEALALEKLIKFRSY